MICVVWSGERRLDNNKNNFEKGTEDKFTIEAPNLGKVRKVTIGHNNKGSSAGWFVDKVRKERLNCAALMFGDRHLLPVVTSQTT